MGAEITANKMTILNTDQGKVTVFEDGVSITDGGTHIGAGKVEFYDQQNMAVIHGGNVNITTPTATVVAESAQYLIGAKRTNLFRNVVIHHGGFTLTSPSVVLDNGSDQITATEDVHVVDTDRGIEITGTSASFNLTSQDGTVSGSPRLHVSRSSGMTVTGDELRLSQTTSQAQATGNVVVLTGDAVLTCDTVWYYFDQDSALANGSPVLKEQDNLVTGDVMQFKFEKDDLKRIHVSGQEHEPKLTRQKGSQKSELGIRNPDSSFIIHPSSLPDDEIVGREITIDFDQGKLAEIGIVGDSLHKPQVRQKDNHATGDSIAFHFLSGEIEHVTLTGHTTGTWFTDDKDRIELSGSETVLRFTKGNASQIEVTRVGDGKLYRHASSANPKSQIPMTKGK